ncbi:hypothetical protein [Hyphomicrobium sp.]|uniref:hypothetical protein n=1 Tax=Hyphomicrobium sp. TaxID=82 RepID=UPI0025C07FE7|nr:hypothetical protein [Hyphomicrobium sp.]
MRIYLDESDAPHPADREAAERIITEIITNDVITQGSFCLEGYSAARRIAQALTAARRDERRVGFATPFRMRRTKPAPGSPVVMAKMPDLRPLYHWITVDGVRLQSYRAGLHSTPMISDDGMIAIREADGKWVAAVNGVEVIGCGLICRFTTAEEAVREALQRIKRIASPSGRTKWPIYGEWSSAVCWP